MQWAMQCARVLALVTFSCATVASAKPEYRQSTCIGPQPGTSLGLAFPQDVAPQSLLVVGVTVLGLTSQITAVTDSLGHQFRPASPLQVGAFNVMTQVWYATGVAAGGPDTVTISFSELSQIIIYVHEYGGFEGGAEVDAMASAVGTGTQMISGPVTTTTVPELLFAYGVSHATAFTPPAGFTTREQCSNDMSADLVVETVGTWNAVFEQSDGAWTSTLVAFKDASPDAGSAGPPDAGPPDAGQPDAALPDAGQGPISFRTSGCSVGAGPSCLALLWLYRRLRRDKRERQ